MSSAPEPLNDPFPPFDMASICIDALDELREKHLSKLFCSFHNTSPSSPGIRFLFSSPPHNRVVIEGYFGRSVNFTRIKVAWEGNMRRLETILDDGPNL